MWPFKKRLPKYLREQLEESCPYKVEPDKTPSEVVESYSELLKKGKIRPLFPMSEGDEQVTTEIPEVFLN